jgi:3-dehydroquinate synthase
VNVRSATAPTTFSSDRGSSAAGKSCRLGDGAIVSTRTSRAGIAARRHHHEGRAGSIIATRRGDEELRKLEPLCEGLLELGLERGDLVVALGGGVIGDLAGFAAAILRRGVRFVQIPTSLLAQVDSSVGGKTGIDTPQGKNLIGAFHQPGLVLADTDVLRTLPERELRAGYAEVAKYGLLGDAPFFAWLEHNWPAVFALDSAALTHAIETSVKAKAGVVGRDEMEQGERALLNLGHTFGHAFEAWCGYSDRLLHGEAIAIGMCLAFRFSEVLGYCPAGSAARVSAHFRAVGLPTRIDRFGRQTRMSRGSFDGAGQKVRRGKLVHPDARRRQRSSRTTCRTSRCEASCRRNRQRFTRAGLC